MQVAVDNLGARVKFLEDFWPLPFGAQGNCLLPRDGAHESTVGHSLKGPLAGTRESSDFS